MTGKRNPLLAMISQHPWWHLSLRLYGIYRPLKYSMLSNINHNSTEIFQENIIYLELIWNDIYYLLIPASMTYLYPNFWRYSVSPCHTVSLIAYHRSVQHSFFEKSFISCEPASVPLWNFQYSVCQIAIHINFYGNSHGVIKWY